MVSGNRLVDFLEYMFGGNWLALFHVSVTYCVVLVEMLCFSGKGEGLIGNEF